METRKTNQRKSVVCIFKESKIQFRASHSDTFPSACCQTLDSTRFRVEFFVPVSQLVSTTACGGERRRYYFIYTP